MIREVAAPDVVAGRLRALCSREPTYVAPRLLGAVLTHGGVSLRLTEVEAYCGSTDPGSHAFRGPTRRNASMFGPPGHLYAYFIYGMHTNVNVVCGPAGIAGGVLLRAGEVVAGAEEARSRRGDVAPRDLARGPARLAQALGFGLTDDGMDLAGLLEPRSRSVPRRLIRTGPRVGLRAAADRPWRFWLDGDPTVSAYRPAARVRRDADRAVSGPAQATTP